MKTPVWVWDRKKGVYLLLPKGIQQFATGEWGYDMYDYLDHDNDISEFYNENKHLFEFKSIHVLNLDWKIVLKRPGPAKYQPRKDKARITKVQR